MAFSAANRPRPPFDPIVDAVQVTSSGLHTGFENRSALGSLASGDPTNSSAIAGFFVLPPCSSVTMQGLMLQLMLQLTL